MDAGVDMGYSAPNCPCPEKDCERHSDCEACLKHHKAKDELPYCARWATQILFWQNRCKRFLISKLVGAGLLVYFKKSHH
jgi:hypothetical protein